MFSIDISEHNGRIEWQAALPSIDLAFVKALGSNQVDRVDPLFERNWSELGKCPRVLRGAYYFWYASDDVLAMARRFLDVVQPLESDDLLAIDCEDMVTSQAISSKGSGGLWKPLKTWLDAIENATCKKAFIYTSPGWWIYWFCKVEGYHYIAPDWANDYPLWLAHYTDADEPMLPIGFSQWVIWQYGKTRVPGCEGDQNGNPLTDVNRLAVSVDELRRRWKGDLTGKAELTLQQKVDLLWQVYLADQNQEENDAG